MRSVTTLILGLGLLAAGCSQASNSAKQAVAKVGDAATGVAEAAKKKFDEMKATFTKDAEEKLGGYDKKLEEWKAKAKDATGDAKTKLEDQIKGGEEALKKAKDQFANLGDTGEDGWEALKKAIEDAMESLKKVFG